MHLRILKEKVLSDCSPDKIFWTCHGSECRNIYELLENIRSQSDESFRFHVNKSEGKNDYAKWITDVLEDEVLGHRLHSIPDKDLYADVIHERIKELENA